MKFAFASALGVLIAAFGVPQYAAAQSLNPVYSICVGQYSNRCPPCDISGGPHQGCTGYDAWYNCSFASNPLQQVKVFCNGRVPNPNPHVWRTKSVNGNQCGYSVIGITCN
jgi:hypothetical protein